MMLEKEEKGIKEDKRKKEDGGRAEKKEISSFCVSTDSALRDGKGEN